MTETVQICNAVGSPVPVNIVSGGGGSSGGLTDTQLRAAAVPVTVGNWPVSWSINNFPASFNIGNFTATQPVSGTVAISNLPATQPVSGSVSITGNVPVTGTFWQATQPVSIATTVNVSIQNASLAVTGPLTDTQLRASAVPISGALTDTQLRASAVPVSLASLPALAAGSAIVGKVGVDQTTPGTTNAFSLSYIVATAVATGNGTASAGCQRVAIASDNSPLAVTAPTLTKGTQAANGFSTQPLRDAGRAGIMLTAEFTFAQVAETMLSLVKNTDGAVAAGATSFVITNGKKFRIQAISIEVESLGSGTAPQRAYLRLRRNTGGATVVGSNLAGVWACCNNTAIVKSAAHQHYDIPESYEMAGDGTATYGFSLETPDWVVTTATGRAKITIVGYEY